MTEQALHSRKWWTMLGIGIGVFMSTLDSSIVNVSLPTLVRELQTDFATIQWVILSYLLVITTLMLSVARLGDMMGKKRLYTIGLVMFTIGSLLSGLSPNVGFLIGFRALQGTGAVMMTSLGTAIITEVFPSSERGRALGISGTIVSIGIALGPTIGGMLIGTVGWRWIFLVNVPIGIIAALIVAKVVPALPPSKEKQRFDPAGALITLLVLGGYALAMTMGQRVGFGNGYIIALLVAAGLGVIVFVVVESRIKQPMIDLSLFKNVLFGVNLLMGLLVFIMIGGQFIIPFFLELVKGYPPTQVGLLMATFPVAMGIVAPISGALSDKFGSRLISLIGSVMIAGGCLALGTLTENSSGIGFVLRMAPLGIGVGMFNSPNNSAIMGTAPRERLGVASGLLALSRTLGQTTGLPLAGAIFSGLVLAQANLPAGADATTAPPHALVAGISGTYRVAAGVIFVASLLAILALWLDARQQAAAKAAEEMAGTV